VASKDAEPWLDLVQADLEAMAYAFGAIAFPSAGIGAPHIRDRTYWVANVMRPRLFPGSLSGIYRGEESPGSRDGEPE
ncbi:DNA cytosine methyltransferase, partial [Escherichia coli]